MSYILLESTEVIRGIYDSSEFAVIGKLHQPQAFGVCLNIREVGNKEEWSLRDTTGNYSFS